MSRVPGCRFTTCCGYVQCRHPSRGRLQSAEPLQPIMRVDQVHAPNEECSMCTRLKDPQIRQVPLWRVQSTHPSRRWVLILCDYCMGEVIFQVKAKS